MKTKSLTPAQTRKLIEETSAMYARAYKESKGTAKDAALVCSALSHILWAINAGVTGVEVTEVYCYGSKALQDAVKTI